ncbi:MAG: hypothetical protein K2O24_03720 [Muribaculaceae bacterium]|nr:hypothetical protein [Muribaculaceae bacterium]
MPYPQNLPLLTRATDSWHSWAQFRAERLRNKRYTYGRQWDDPVSTPSGTMSEGELLREEGGIPLSSNMVRRTVRNVTGVWRGNFEYPRPLDNTPEQRQLNALLKTNMRLNHAAELYARTLEEFLISGLAIHRKWHGFRGGVAASWTDSVTPDTFFMDSDASDFRGWDIRLIGQIHTLDFDTLLSRFSSDAESATALTALYGTRSGEMCRVLEVWHRVSRPPVMPGLPPGERWMWCYLTPDGHVLAEGETPYAHGEHPYVVKAYPYIDGEVHSFVSDIIDQQRLINRLVSLYDRVLRASAKGVLLFPEHALPPGADLREVAEQWSRADGVIMYTAKAGMPAPQQTGGLSAAPGITDLLTLQMKMMEDISGVNSALQGKLESSSTSGTLYERQTRNALTSIRDLTATFDHFLTLSQAKDLSNLRQWGN